MDKTPLKPEKRKRGRPKSAFNDGTPETLQSVERALAVLTAVSQLGRTTLSDLSLSMGIPTATAHKILTTLHKCDYLAYDEDAQDWMVGIEAYRTGTSFLSQSTLTEVGRKVMRKLAKETGETANLAVHDKFEVVFIGQIETTNPIRAFFPPGTRTAMHASGAGKAILSAIPEDQVRYLLEISGLERFTEHTIISPTSLFSELATARELGWSVDQEERYLGMSCIGGVIFDSNEQPLAAVSISGPNSRFTKAKIPEFGITVAKAASEITRLTGGSPPDDWPSCDD
jgi:IclR family acetate operon transcriptional repressor